MAFVLGVIALIISSQSMLKVSSSISTKTGFNLNKAITSTVAAKVKSDVMISSPGFKSKLIKAI